MAHLKTADELARRRRADRWGKAGATLGAAQHVVPAVMRYMSGGPGRISVSDTLRSAATGYGVGRAAHRVMRGSVKEGAARIEELAKIAVSGQWVHQGAYKGMQDRIAKQGVPAIRPKVQEMVQKAQWHGSPNRQRAALGALNAYTTKTSSAWRHGAELAGLGVLAKPSIDEYRGKHVSSKKKAVTEMAGLGILAAPSAIDLAHSAVQKFRGVPKVAGILSGMSVDPTAFTGRARVLSQKLPTQASSLQQSVQRVATPVRQKLVPDSSDAFSMLQKIQAMKAGR